MKTLAHNKDQMSLTNHAMHCITANVLQTKVDARCDKLATELSWQRFVSKVANFRLLHMHLPSLAAFGTPGTISVKFFSGCQWMAKVANAVEILRKIWTAWVGRTNVTDDRQTDGRQQIVNVTSRSLKMSKLLKLVKTNVTYILIKTVTQLFYNLCPSSPLSASHLKEGWSCIFIGTKTSYHLVVLQVHIVSSLQCLNTVGWVTGRACSP